MRFHFPVFDLPPEAEALRAEVRAFIAEEMAAGRWKRGGDFASHYDPEFSRRLGTRGWLGMTWPRQYGGHARSTLERLVVTEELLAANAPVAAHWIADGRAGRCCCASAPRRSAKPFCRASRAARSSFRSA